MELNTLSPVTGTARRVAVALRAPCATLHWKPVLHPCVPGLRRANRREVPDLTYTWKSTLTSNAGACMLRGAAASARDGSVVTRGSRNGQLSGRGAGGQHASRRDARPIAGLRSAHIPKTEGAVSRLDLMCIDDASSFATPRRPSIKHLVRLAIIIRWLRVREILRISQVGSVAPHHGGHIPPWGIEQPSMRLVTSPAPCMPMLVGRCSILPTLHGDVRGGPGRPRNPNGSNRSAGPDGLLHRKSAAENDSGRGSGNASVAHLWIEIKLLRQRHTGM